MFIKRLLFSTIFVTYSLVAADLASTLEYIDYEEEAFLSSLSDDDTDAKAKQSGDKQVKTVAKPNEATKAPAVTKEKKADITAPPKADTTSTEVSDETTTPKKAVTQTQKVILETPANIEVATQNIVDNTSPSKIKPENNISKPTQVDQNISLDIKVDLSDQIMTVTQDGVELYRWRVSTGTKDNPTPKGKYKPEFFKKLYKDEDTQVITMHYAIFFNDIHAIVATQSKSALGSRASKTGGVRIAMDNAKTLFELVVKTGKDNTNISIVK